MRHNFIYEICSYISTKFDHSSLVGCSNFLYPKLKFGREFAIKETNQKQD